MDIERQKSFIVRLIFWLMVAGIVYVALKYAVPLLAPFVVGGLVAIALGPLAEWLARVTGLRRKWTAIVLLLIFYIGAGLLLFLAGAKIFTTLKNLVIEIPGYYVSVIEPALRDLFGDLALILEELDPSLRSTAQTITSDFISTLTSMVRDFSVRAFDGITSIAGSLPGFFIRFIFAIVTSFFFSADMSGINVFFRRQIAPKYLRIFHMLRSKVIGTLGKYVKAYSLLLALTFTELSVGFLLIGVQNAFLTALGIAIFDVLPVLGVGGILIPWAIISFIVGSTAEGVKLLILYVLITAVRNTLEPKIVGEQIGLHPLVTLLCMYVGASLFGVLGLIGLPVTAAILKNLNDEGIWKFLK
ncbi:MAG: sporulation integral membrane protein YtvI [Peptococcaceae bacterium]|jgi:sporulation integral membrane protein YtvI|nr:sporulation integral membrane protein YtvI [Peptococcaceae bacterium]